MTSTRWPNSTGWGTLSRLINCVCGSNRLKSFSSLGTDSSASTRRRAWSQAWIVMSTKSSNFVLSRSIVRVAGPGLIGNHAGSSNSVARAEDPVGHVEQGPVGVLKPLAVVTPLARGDPVDGAQVLLHGAEQVPVLTPATHPQEAGQAFGRRHDRAEAVADEARIGGIVDVGGHHERVAPDRRGGLGDEPMPLGDDQVVEPLDRVGRQQADVVAEASPVERLVVAPTVDAHDPSQGTMLLGEVLESVVVEVAPEPDGPQDEDRPVGYPRAALVGPGGPIDVVGD